MSGQLPIDRVREQERSNQPKMDRAKEKFAKKQSAIEDKARTHDDDAATDALKSGDTPAAKNADAGEE